MRVQTRWLVASLALALCPPLALSCGTSPAPEPGPDAGAIRPDALPFVPDDAGEPEDASDWVPPDAGPLGGPDGSSRLDASSVRPDASAVRPDGGVVKGAPDAPFKLTAKPVGPGRVDLGWVLGPAQVDGVNVDRAAHGKPATIVGIAPGAATAYSDTKANPATLYSYRVIAYNAKGDSLPSVPATATTPAAPTVPAAPSGLAATATSSTEIALRWTDASGDESGFNVYQSTSGGPFTLRSQVGPNETSTTLSGLAPSTGYGFRVTAFNGAGESLAAGPVSATTQAPPVTAPAAPSGLTATVLSSSSVTLAWVDNASNEVGFGVQLSASGGPYTALPVSVQANGRSLTVIDLLPSTAYRFQVWAFNSAGKSALTAPASANTPASTTQPTETGTIIVDMVPGAPSPLMGGTFPATPQLGNNQAMYGDFDSNQNHLVDWYTGPTVLNTCVYPMQPAAGQSKYGVTWVLKDCRAYNGTANIAILATFSSWTSVARPQFVSLHLQTQVQNGQNVIVPISMWAGDQLDDAPLPLGAFDQGVIMTTAIPGVTPYLTLQLDGGRLPQGTTAGFLKGTAVGNLNFVTEWGTVYSSRVTFKFDVSLLNDQ
ncbi:MAG: fibronectin type III domain-containing protein [Deltaproteobacteria bacterium]|nr:fibronectin type III domain-containing protein [Deltaproteobacteria bacterium]